MRLASDTCAGSAGFVPCAALAWFGAVVPLRALCGVLAAGGMMCRPCRLRALWGLLGGSLLALCGSWSVLISSAGCPPASADLGRQYDGITSAGLAASSALGAGVALRVAGVGRAGSLCPLPVLSSFLPS